MFLCFWTFPLLVWKDILFRRCGDFAQCWDENMHFWALSRLRQSGRKSKKYLVDMSCFWRAKIVCFTSFKDQFNPRQWKKALKVPNFEAVNSAICTIFTVCHCKKLDARRWSHFPPEKVYFEIFSKNNAVSITFGLRYIHGQSLKGNWFSYPKRSGPVLGRPLLKCSNFVSAACSTKMQHIAAKMKNSLYKCFIQSQTKIVGTL